MSPRIKFLVPLENANPKSNEVRQTKAIDDRPWNATKTHYIALGSMGSSRIAGGSGAVGAAAIQN